MSVCSHEFVCERSGARGVVDNVTIITNVQIIYLHLFFSPTPECACVHGVAAAVAAATAPNALMSIFCHYEII